MSTPPQGDATGGLIPYKNAPALVGYYLGIFSLIPFLGMPLCLPALICGVIGLKKVNREPQLSGRAHAWIAIVLGGLVSLGYLALVALILMAPS